MDRFARALTARAGWVIAAAVALTGLALAQLVDLRSGSLQLAFDPSLDRLVSGDDAERAFYARVRRVFGSRDTLFIPLIGDSLFSTAHLETVTRISRQLEALPGVHRVVSLATVPVLRTEGDELRIEPFLANIPANAQALAALRAEALANPLLVDSLVSRDGRAAAILVELASGDAAAPPGSVEAAAERILASERGDLEGGVLGGPSVTARVSQLLLADLLRLLPIAFLAVTGVALLAFRSLRGVLVPAAAIAVALIWTLGAIHWAGAALNLITSLVPVLVVTVGFAYAIHLMSEYDRRVRAGDPDPARAALAQVALPMALAGLTTAVGFASLALGRLDAIREFGAYAVLGVVCSVTATATLVPALLHLLPPARPHRRALGTGRFERFARRLGAFDVRHRRAILWAGAAVAAVSLVGVARLRVGTDVIGSFPPENPLRRQYDTIEKHFGGANVFYAVLRGPRDAFKEPANLRALRELQTWLAARPDVVHSTSLVDYLMLVNQGLHAGDPAHFAIPDSRRSVAQLLFLVGGGALERFVDAGFETAIVTVRSKALESGAMAEQIAEIEARLATLPAPLRASVTGPSVFAARTLNELARGQLRSLAAAFLGIYAVLALVFASPRAGALALLPNALPVLAYFGILGLTGIPLDATTGLVACMVLGIAVDDTLHYLVRFERDARRLADEKRGAVEALAAVGRPVTFTTLALCLGLLALTGSELRNQVQFGALAAATLAIAWVVDIVLTPALASRMRIVTLWEVLALDLGEDPQRSIPVFRGMSARQARRTALLTHIHSCPAGTRLLAQGAVAEQLYVVIDGALEMTARDARGETHRSRLGRGEVVGEAALFRGRCPADVVAESDVRLLQFSRAQLAELVRRAPGIAGRFHRNLADVLLERIHPLGRQARMRLMQFVCSLAWADTRLQREERAMIARLVARLDLDTDERQQVEGWLAEPAAALDPALVPREHRVLFLQAMAAMVLADGEIAESEIEHFRPLLG